MSEVYEPNFISRMFSKILNSTPVEISARNENFLCDMETSTWVETENISVWVENNIVICCTVILGDFSCKHNMI